MKYYTQFLVKYTPDGKIQELLGSDGVFILDGRNSLGMMCKDSIAWADKLKNVQPNIVGFKIMKGRRFTESQEVHRWIMKKKDS